MTVTECEVFRRNLKQIADEVRKLVEGDAPAEAKANVMLTYRHLEDASMRLGKAIQALDGGVSVYDKSQVPGA